MITQVGFEGNYTSVKQEKSVSKACRKIGSFVRNKKTAQQVFVADKKMRQFFDKPSLPQAVTSLTIIIGAMNPPPGGEREGRSHQFCEEKIQPAEG